MSALEIIMLTLLFAVPGILYIVYASNKKDYKLYLVKDGFKEKEVQGPFRFKVETILNDHLAICNQAFPYKDSLTGAIKYMDFGEQAVLLSKDGYGFYDGQIVYIGENEKLRDVGRYIRLENNSHLRILRID